jgi:hypothetical protein
MIDSYDPLQEEDDDPTFDEPVVDRKRHRRPSMTPESAGHASTEGTTVGDMLQQRRRSIHSSAPAAAAPPNDEASSSGAPEAAMPSALVSTGSSVFADTLDALAELEEHVGSVETVLAQATSGTAQPPAEAPAAAYGTFGEDGANTAVSLSSTAVSQTATNQTPLLDVPSVESSAKRASIALAGVACDAWRPFIWRNPETLPIIVRCPNSGEAAHVHRTALWAEHTSDVWGTARWGRASRLSGADEVHTFDTWSECRAWMHTNLRAPCVAESGCKAVAAGSLGAALGADGSTQVYLYSGVPVSLLAPTAGSPQWLLTVSRDRGEVRDNGQARHPRLCLLRGVARCLVDACTRPLRLLHAPL